MNCVGTIATAFEMACGVGDRPLHVFQLTVTEACQGIWGVSGA